MVLLLLNPFTLGAFCQKNRIFWTFWRFSAWKWTKLAPIYSKRHLQHGSMPFFPLATHFKTFLLRHAQKVDQKLKFLDEKVTYIFRPVLSVRFKVESWLKGPKALFPLVENEGIQPVICKRVPVGSSGESQVLLKALLGFSSFVISYLFAAVVIDRLLGLLPVQKILRKHHQDSKFYSSHM